MIRSIQKIGGKLNRLFSLFIIASILLMHVSQETVTAQIAVESDWPSARHDPAGTFFAEGETLLAAPLELSTFITTNSQILSGASPILANGYLFLLEDDGFCAYLLADLTQTWCYNGLEQLIVSGVTGSEIVVGGINPVDDTLTLVRLDISDGTTIGMVPTAEHAASAYTCSPADRNQMFCSSDEHLLSIDLSTNSVVWTMPLDGPGSVPVLSEDAVFVETGLSAWAINREDGAVIWTSNQSTGSRMPLLLAGTTLLVSQVDGSIRGLDALTGTLSWSSPVLTGEVCQAAYGNGDLIITTHSGFVEKLSPLDGTVVWSLNGGTSELTACPSLVMANGYAYSNFPDGTIKAIDLSTGSMVWEAVAATPGKTAGMAISGGYLVIPVSPTQVAFYAKAGVIENPPLDDTEDTLTYLISGTILDLEGAPLPGIIVADGLGHTATTDETGAYTITGLTPGEISIIPTSEVYEFTPLSFPLTVVDADHTEVDFIGQSKPLDGTEASEAPEGEPVLTGEGLPPEITTLNPYSSFVNEPSFTTLMVHGLNFVAGSTVKWGETSLVTTFIDVTSLTAVVTPDLTVVAGEYTITVINPELESGSSNAVSFTIENPRPLLYALTPAQSLTRLSTDPAITVEVTGANFVACSQVNWDTTGLNTTYLSPTQLRVEVPSSYLGEPLRVPLTVVNAAPGGGVSSELTFSVEEILPADGQKLATSKVTFDWADSPGANAYQIQLSLYNNFSKPIINGPVYSSRYYFGRALANGKTYYWRYRARIGASWDVWTPTYKFYSLNPPLAPVMLTPNRTLKNHSEVLLSWNETANAEKYQVQISKYYKFTSTVQDVVVPDKGTSFTTSALADGLYYWRVRGIDSVGVNGSWSGYRSFTIDTVLPVTPQLTSPSDGAYITTTSPTLAVKPVSDAGRYCFQMADNPAFDNPLVNPTCAQSTTSTNWTVPVEAALGYQTYYWRAMAVDAAGNYSIPAISRLLNLTLMQSPADSSFTPSLTPEFTWIGLPGASEYKLQVSTSQDFISPILIDETLTSTTFIPADDMAFGSYYLRLKVDTGDWMPVQHFTISPVSAAPVLLAPSIDAIINDRTPSLDWSIVEATTIPITGYEIQVSKDTVFSSIVQSETTENLPPYVLPELMDGLYYWRVRAINALDAPGVWSAVASFRVDSTPVKPPPYYSPASGATTTTTLPKLSVKRVSGAVSYRFQVATTPTFTESLLLDKLVKPGLTYASYAPTTAEALPFGTVYWRAATVDPAGNEAWGESRALVVNILKTPNHGTTITVPTPAFSWGEATGALQYELLVASRADFAVESVVISEVLAPMTSYTSTTTLPPGSYYWRLRVDYGAGFSENCTPTYSFIVSPVTPTTPYIMEPGSGNYTNDPSPRFRWVDTFNVTAPQLRIKNRTIQVYLPPDYATSGKSYPVLYLNDGNTKFINGYYIDDTLEELYRNGQINGLIAVAIFNSANRWDEFSPWVNTHMKDVWYVSDAASSEGGEGDAYVDFLVDTLKPIIDNRYRTMTDREHTALGAGSLGGFITLYAAYREPDVFSKVMVLSPAVWFGESGGAWLSNNRLINYISSHPLSQESKFFIYIGTNEWNGRTLRLPGMTYPKVWVSGVNAVKAAIESHPNSEVYLVTNSGGIHSPTSWRWWVDDAITWLFADSAELPDSLPPADGSREDQYEIQVSTTNRFTTLTYSGLTLDGQQHYEAPSLADGRYFWRVRAVNDVGTPGSWSAPADFRLDTTPPALPVYSSPAENEITTTATPRLIIKRVSDAANYRFQVAATPEFSGALLLDKTVTSISLSPSYLPNAAETLPFGLVYWRAGAVDKAGNESWGEERSFIVSNLKTPITGTTTTNTKPTLSWGAISGVVQYQVQLARTELFEEETTENYYINPPVTSFIPTNRLLAGNYYWRLRVNSGTGFSESWTPVASFIVSPVIPSAPVITSPVAGHYTNDLSPHLRWVESFQVYSPQLRVKYRTIQVYLPPDYATSGKSYPVLYLSDGSLQFEKGFYTDETLEALFYEGQIEGVIAVGVFTNPNRWDEYSPWINTDTDTIWHNWHADAREGGEGDAYIDFFVDTLKPIIDNRYRTLRDREYTAIGGASMGGLITLYGGLREPEVFSKVISLSPAVWYAEDGGKWLSNNRLLEYIRNHPQTELSRFYIFTGTNEWNGRRLTYPGWTYPKIWKSGVDAVYQTLTTTNPDIEIKYDIYPGGIHQTSTWRNWMDEAILWLFDDIEELPVTPPEDDPTNNGLAEDHYEVQISTSQYFNTIEYQGSTLGGQFSLEDAALKPGKHYWHVRAVNRMGVPGRWSSTSYLVIDTTAPGAPVPVSPGMNAVTYDTTPAFSVKSVASANLYCFQVADTETFENILVNADCAMTTAKPAWSVPSINKLPYGANYYWRAAALDVAGNISDWSGARRFTVSIMQSPLNGSNLTGFTPRFVWAGVAGAWQYQLQVSADAAFLDPNLGVMDVQLPTSTAYTSPTPFTAGKYYWRIRVMVSDTYGDWMPVQTFTVSPIPVAPALDAPVSGALTNDNTPLLSWQPVVDPFRPVSGYQVQVGRSPYFTTYSTEDVAGANSYETNAVTVDGRYYWRVRAVNDLGVYGKWSSSRSIVVDSTPPAVPSLIIPLDGINVHGIPFYYWRSDSSAKYYQFEFATDVGFTNIEYQTGELSVAFHILPGQKRGAYYWHVRARDLAGNWSNWSETRLITIAP